MKEWYTPHGDDATSIRAYEIVNEVIAQKEFEDLLTNGRGFYREPVKQGEIEEWELQDHLGWLDARDGKFEDKHVQLGYLCKGYGLDISRGGPIILMAFSLEDCEGLLQDLLGRE